MGNFKISVLHTDTYINTCSDIYYESFFVCWGFFIPLGDCKRELVSLSYTGNGTVKPTVTSTLLGIRNAALMLSAPF